LAVAAILSVVVAALIPALSLGRQTWGRVDKHSEMLENARRVMDKLVRDVRAARSFRVITPTLVRFTMALGDGSGATPTVEYQLNGATNNLEVRMSANFDYRRRLTVAAGTSAVPAGYSVSVVVNHAALVTAGKSLASGDDVRILYWTGTQWVELDRFKDPTTAWNTAATQIWFKLQAAIAANSSASNYYLHYGDLSAAPPPANADYVFLDYEDGSSLAGWTRRDACTGTNSASADGFVFQAADTSGCHRQFSKNVPNSDVEIFWGFWDSAADGSDGLQAGVSARRSDTGVGYVVAVADQSNTAISIRYWTTWSTTGGAIGSTPATITPGTSYYGRFYLVGSALKVKYWAVGATEPGWMLQVTDTAVTSGLHYGQVDGYAGPSNHRHRYVIVRQRVATDPAITQAAEESGTRTDVFQPLGGPFRAMTVTCYDAADASINCSGAASVKSVQISLTIMDPTGEVADIVVTSRAYRQTP
jgi:hypothetical protein